MLCPEKAGEWLKRNGLQRAFGYLIKIGFSLGQQSRPAVSRRKEDDLGIWSVLCQVWSKLGFTFGQLSHPVSLEDRKMAEAQRPPKRFWGAFNQNCFSLAQQNRLVGFHRKDNG